MFRSALAALACCIPLAGHAAYIDVTVPGSSFVFGPITVDGSGGLFGPGDVLYFEPLSGAYGPDGPDPDDLTDPDLWLSVFYAKEAGGAAVEFGSFGPIGGTYFATEADAFDALRAEWDAAYALDNTPDAFALQLNAQTQIDLYAYGDNSNPSTGRGGLNLRIHVNRVTTQAQPAPAPGALALFLPGVLALAGEGSRHGVDQGVGRGNGAALGDRRHAPLAVAGRTGAPAGEPDHPSPARFRAGAVPGSLAAPGRCVNLGVVLDRSWPVARQV